VFVDQFTALRSTRSRQETRLSEDRLLSRQAEYDTMEEGLTKARRCAELINDPVIAYFIDMALSEVRMKAPTGREPHPSESIADSRLIQARN
jgi:hypothetical protein